MRQISLTDGSIAKKLILFSIPMILGNLLQQVYNIADTLIVGRFLGADALAAVGSSYTLMVFITSVIIGLCMGSGAFFSEDYGAGNEKLLAEDVRLSFLFIGSVTAAIILLIYPGMDLIVSMLKTPEHLIETTKDYVRVVFAGIVFVFLYNFFAYLLRSTGDSVSSLIFLAISSVMNIFLDIIFIVVFELGVEGAAVATVISQVFSAVGIMIYAQRKLGDIKDAKVSLRGARLKEIVCGDIATGIQQSVMNFGILMIQGLVNSFGASIMASFAAAVKIDTLAYMPAQEFSNGYSLFVSQNKGACESQRIKEGSRYAFLISTLFCLFVSVMIFIFAPDLMSVFVGSSELQIIKDGAVYLRIEGAMYVGIGILFLWYGYFRGIGKPRISLILTVISLGTRVALSYAFSKSTSLGVIIIWLSIPIGWILADIAGYIFYRKVN